MTESRSTPSDRGVDLAVYARSCVRRLLMSALLLIPAAACASNEALEPDPAGALNHYSETGRASYYSSQLHGRRTASGAIYDQTRLTAAHPSLPFGTLVCVTNRQNQQSVMVEINDRGPYSGKRVIDLSLRAAKEIGMTRAGTVRVDIETCEES